MRRLKYHVAITVDGFIAHEDHTVDGFLAEGDHVADYLAALKSDYDAVIMGRRTYEFGFQYGVTSPYPWLQQFVLSRSMEASPDPAVTLVREDAVGFVRTLKNESGGAIYLCGGSRLAASLWGAGLVDDLILKVNPVIFGAGLPLFGGPLRTTDLTLYDSKIYPNGVALMSYSVHHPESLPAV